jgi:hypothetical protein
MEPLLVSRMPRWALGIRTQEKCNVTKTLGAAVGALIIVLFMAHIASRLVM